MFYRLALAIALICVFCSSVSSEEMRGAWVTAWTDGFLTKSQADATISAAKSAGINTLFIQVRKTGDSYYSSKIEPRGNGLASGFDPLAYIIQESHKSGIQVHAWVNVLRVWYSHPFPTDTTHPIIKYPEWISRDPALNITPNDDVFFDPGIPAVVDYTVSIMEDIAKRYNVDGIHMDYIRYQEMKYGYSKLSLNEYTKETGIAAPPLPNDPLWIKWKQKQITNLIEKISQKIKQVKPKIALTATVVCWGDCPASYEQRDLRIDVGQDWQDWLKRGLVDAVIPMNYRREATPAGASQFRLWLSAFNEWRAGKKIFVGIESNMNTNEGISSQIDAVRNIKLNGYVLFSFNDTDNRDKILDTIKRKNAKNEKS